MNILKFIGAKKEMDPLVKVRYDMRRIFSLGTLAILIALLAMSTLSLRITRNQVLERLKTSELSNTAVALSANIESRIERSIETSRLLALDPFIVEWVKNEGTSDDQLEMIRQRFSALVDKHGYSTAFLTSKLTGNYWSANPGEGFNILSTLSPEREDDAWFYNTLEINTRYVVSIDDNVDLGETFLWVNTLVGDISHPIAITGVGLNLTDVISDLIASENLQALPADIWFVDGTGTITLSNKEAFMGNQLKAILPKELTKALDDEGSSETYVNVFYEDGQEEYDLVYKPLPNTDWLLLVRIARSQSLGFLERIRLNTIVSASMIILVVVGLFWILSRRVADPYSETLTLNKELENRVAERTAELLDKNEKINASIEAASVIQQAILPTYEKLRAQLDGYAICWLPRDQVGGDFYWTSTIGERKVIVLGDCTGHGVPGAMMTMAVNTALEHIVSSECFEDPSLLLSRLNDEIGHILGETFGGERVQPGLDAVCLMFEPNGSLLFSGARLDLFLRSKKEIKRIQGQRVTIDGTHVGQELNLETVVMDTADIDEIYIATDGFFDQPGGNKRLPYGKKRFMQAIADIKGETLEEKMQVLMEHFSDYVNNEHIRDDITLLFIKPKKL